MYKSEQLARSIRALIENGSWQAHSKLPSLREQVQRSGFSLMTVLNAYQELEAQGLRVDQGLDGIFWSAVAVFGHSYEVFPSASRL